MSTAEKELENCPTLEEIDEKLEETEKEFQETREEVEKLHVKDDCHHDQAESCAKSFDEKDGLIATLLKRIMDRDIALKELKEANKQHQKKADEMAKSNENLILSVIEVKKDHEEQFKQRDMKLNIIIARQKKKIEQIEKEREELAQQLEEEREKHIQEKQKWEDEVKALHCKIEQVKNDCAANDKCIEQSIVLYKANTQEAMQMERTVTMHLMQDVHKRIDSLQKNVFSLDKNVSKEATEIKSLIVSLALPADKKTLSSSDDSDIEMKRATGVSSSSQATSRKRKQKGGTGDTVQAMKKNIRDSMTKNRICLTSAFQHSLKPIAEKLIEVGILPKGTHDHSPTPIEIIQCFESYIGLMDDQSRLEEKCDEFLSALTDAGGPAAEAANFLRKEWEMAGTSQTGY